MSAIRKQFPSKRLHSQIRSNLSDRDVSLFDYLYEKVVVRHSTCSAKDKVDGREEAWGLYDKSLASVLASAVTRVSEVA